MISNHLMHTLTKVNYLYSYIKGIALINQGKFDEAIDMYDYALEINPANADTYSKKGWFYIKIFIGVALSHLGRFSDAIIMFDLALNIDPGQADIYNNKG